MKSKSLQAFFIILLMGVATHAVAAGTGIDNAGLLDDLLNRFSTTASTWSGKLVEYGSWLFWGLTLISMVWTFGFMALRKADLQEFLAEMLRFFVTTESVHLTVSPR